MKRKKTDILYPVLGIGGFLLLWQLLAGVVIRREWLLPEPVAVCRALAENFSLLLQHSRYTLTEALLGLGISVLLGLALAWLMSACRPLRQTLYPLVVGSQLIPVVVFAPLFLIWFGYGILPKVLVVVLICFFPMAVNSLAGLEAVSREMLDFYRVMGMNGAQLFFRVRLPYALPYFFSGLKVSAAYSVMGAVIGEWLGAEGGLGLVLTRAQRSFDLPLVFAAIVLIICWSALIFALIRLGEALTLHWNPNQRKEE